MFIRGGLWFAFAMLARLVWRGGILPVFLTAWLGVPILTVASTNAHVILVTIDGLRADCLSDPQAPIPTLRKLAAEGVSAQAMRVSNPAITWPNHTTLVTGVHPEKHSVLFNGVLVKPGPGQPVYIDGRRSQGELVAVPTLYDRLHDAGYRTASVNWPCTRGSTALDDNFPDVLEQITHLTPRLRDELLALGILDDDSDAAFRARSPASRDQVWTAAAIHLIQARRPNLLLLHLLITDTIQHRYGPQSPATYAAIALADAHLAEILSSVTVAEAREETTIFVTSDHGFGNPSKLVNPNVIFRKAGLLRPAPRTRVQAISEGGVAFVYLTDPVTRKEDRARVFELLHGQEGIARIVEPAEFFALHLPDPAKNPQMADLILIGAQGYAFADEVFEEQIITELTNPSGSHGFLATDSRMNGIFVAQGHGIRRGIKLGIVDNIDVAPTIAAVLGVTLPNVDGKVLREILTSPIEH